MQIQLIVDEPTTVLDFNIQKKIVELLSDHVEEKGFSLILITYDIRIGAENFEKLLVIIFMKISGRTIH